MTPTPQDPIQNNPSNSEPMSFDQFVAMQEQQRSQPGIRNASPHPEAMDEKEKEKDSPLFWVLVALIVLVGGGLIAYFALRPAKVDPAAYRFTEPSEYYLYVPKNYTDAKTWPVVIGIHGTGGSGLNCWNLWQQYADKEGFILLCPTLSDANGGWYQSAGEEKLTNVLYRATFDYNVESQYFLVGFSAGAQFVQGYAFNYPEKVKAVAVLSAGNYYPPSPAAGGIPFLVLIGSRDDQGAIAMSLQFSQALADNGSSVDYWLIPAGHQVTKDTHAKLLDFYHKIYGE